MANKALRLARSSSLSAGVFSSCCAVLLNAARALVFNDGVSVDSRCCACVRSVSVSSVAFAFCASRSASFTAWPGSPCWVSSSFDNLPPAACKSASVMRASLPCAPSAPNAPARSARKSSAEPVVFPDVRPAVMSVSVVISWGRVIIRVSSLLHAEQIHPSFSDPCGFQLTALPRFVGPVRFARPEVAAFSHASSSAPGRLFASTA